MIVTLLTDYGRDDDFVGVCHGVIRGIHPEAEIVDITHGIERYAVRQGALVLRNTLPYMPIGVHVAVVDPQVGTERRAIALRTGDGRMLVGPDNGLLSLAWERCGGVELAVDVTRSPHRLEPVSATFHGRDIFAPVAAHLAGGRRARRRRRPARPGHARDRGAARAAGGGRRGGGARARDRPLRQRRPERGPRAARGHRHHARRQGRGGGERRAATSPPTRRRSPT